MPTSNPLRAFLASELDNLQPREKLRFEFRVIRDIFGGADDSSTENVAKDLAQRHGCTFRNWTEQGLGVFKRPERSLK